MSLGLEDFITGAEIDKMNFRWEIKHSIKVSLILTFVINYMCIAPNKFSSMPLENIFLIYFRILYYSFCSFLIIFYVFLVFLFFFPCLKSKVNDIYS